MARRSNKRKRGNGGEVVNERHKIAELIDSQASKKRKSSPTVENTTGLREEYQSLLARFNPTPDKSVSDGGSVAVTIASQIPQDQPIDGDDEVKDSQVDEKQEDNKPSKRKLRKIAKPSLSELKKSAVYPEVIEWYDCDAQYPTLLVKIKSSKNVVPVPAHWQTKREYLSGRSLLEKRPFELPDIIKQTDIEVMRKTIPGEEDGQDDPSLKQISRARIQPKLGSLDMDYKKLHDVFFKLGARWKPDILLPYGDEYYENRNLYDEAIWKKYEREKRPGTISSKLREIMGISEGQLPPWCSKMKAAGMPPSYPNLKIAGLNWGIENLNGEVYGVLDKPETAKSPSSLFGTIISLDDEPSAIEESDTRQESVLVEPAEQKIEPAESTMIDDERKQSIQTLDTPLPAEANVPRESSSAPKTLYTVLKEKVVDGAAVDQGPAYVMPGAAEEQDDQPKESSEEQQDQNDIEFKF